MDRKLKDWEQKLVKAKANQKLKELTPEEGPHYPTTSGTRPCRPWAGFGIVV